MSASLRFRVGVAAAGLSCLLLGYAAAQQAATPGNDPNASGQTDRSSAQQTDRSTTPSIGQTYGESAQSHTANYRGAQTAAGGLSQAVDHYLANCLLGQNQSEVQLSELAKEKSENAEVKQFAQKMIDDHRKLIEQLQPLAGMQAGTGRGAAESATRSSDAATLPGPSTATETTAPSGTTAAAPRIGTSTDVTTSTTTSTADQTSAHTGALHQLGQIERQIGERCTQATREELQQKSGAEFDKAFVGVTIGAHIHTLAALEVVGQQTQGQLAQVAQQAQPIVKQHLEQAKQLMKELAVQSSSTGSQAERQSTKTER
jgi:predicted outer membrane protein